MPTTTRYAAADAFYLIAHEKQRGKPHLHKRAINVGLAAALTGELIEAGCATIVGDNLWFTGTGKPEDATAQQVWDLLRGKHSDLNMWLRFLSQSAYERVVRRLLDNGVVEPDRAWLFSPVRYVPKEPTKAEWLGVELRRDCDAWRTGEAADPPHVHELLIIGLLVATELTGVLWDGSSLPKQPPTPSPTRADVAPLPEELKALLDRTAQVIAEAVLAR